MKSKNLDHIVLNPNDSVYTQTSFSGRLRWYYKPLYDEPILQQEQVINIIENYIIVRQELKWIDVPIVQYTNE